MTHVEPQIEQSSPSASGVNPSVNSPRDVQRAALEELLTLATQCAATEEQIERQFHLATEQANKEWDSRQKEIESHYTT